MSYELLKQLKDAGFQQDKRNGYYAGSPRGWFPWEKHLRVYVPTLSELIEACGDSFFELTFWNTKWGNKETYWSAEGRWQVKEIITRGYTPEETVGKLWLELNKK